MPDHDAGEIARRSAHAMYAADVASRGLGIEIDGVDVGRATGRMTVTSQMVNGHGIAHGGYVFLLADTAFAFACNARGVRTVARSAEIVFLRPVHAGDRLVATASERARQGRTGVYDVTVTDETGATVAEFRGQSTEIGGAVGLTG
jgi:acyl-CoA thioesterase